MKQNNNKNKAVYINCRFRFFSLSCHNWCYTLRLINHFRDCRNGKEGSVLDSRRRSSASDKKKESVETFLVNIYIMSLIYSMK
jgi:hypothetical protein